MEESAAPCGPIAADLHHKFVHELDDNTQWKAQHLKMNGVYWGLSSLVLLHRMDYKPGDVVDFVLSCYNGDGGFGGNADMDSHLLHTMSAVQLLCMFDAVARIDVERTARWIASMQLPDGSFQGDEWGEVDTRFSYIALSCLRLLGRCECVDVEAAVQYVLRCQNWDGGFGVSPGAESHAGQIFCCVGALCIANALDRIDRDRVAAWLAMRQLPSGGLNGRPEKKADVCYSWWVVSSLSALGRTSWIDKEALFQYILSCQDTQDGGFSDKPGNQPDVYHTFFGLCGLSLLGYEGYKLNPINPVYALSYDILDRLNIAPEHGSQVGRRVPRS
ncbi:putative geranylgeranyltransferase [Leishmania major strain Friedlin]|uniref:Geranylgeranyl transferase type-2 subunit beta n=1 Tax=Leishmania major TaxID=5664 RepID=Q4Q2D8_LEIMA|nr:putative geranylgeranyltransferase [Leishmania major strain Friedlin]CAG9582285.1 geranylgeranyltransferase_-_putative [Leishmania major strain Friedlin]CAJ08127.1 putative geranylgeranyltransferase [Leishmania major strain Friedlin]|eukprot:XP_001686510.1 putative geranylgeranyltransferase [Leishmania major strain Friedlin]